MVYSKSTLLYVQAGDTARGQAGEAATTNQSAKKGAAKTRKAVNTTAWQARSKVKKAVAKTSKTADTNARQARSKVKCGQ